MKLGFIRAWSKKLGTQMTIVVAGLFIVVVLLLSILGRATMQAELLKTTQRYTVQVLSQVILNVEYYISDMESIAKVANSQPEILSMLFEDGALEYNRSTFYKKSQAVQVVLRSIATMRSELGNIIIAGENGSISDIRSNYFTLMDANLVGSDWYNAAMEAGGKFIYTPPYMQNYSINTPVPVISIAKSISMYEGGKGIGVVLIELNLQALKQICSNVKLHESGYVFIVDSNGNYIYHPNNLYVSRVWEEQPVQPIIFEDDEVVGKILQGEATFTFGKGDKKQYVTSRALDGTQWTVVGVVPYDEVFSSAKSVGNTQLSIGLFSALVVAIIIAILFSRMVFMPIENLRIQMGRVEKGDFDVSVVVSRDNEIGQFSRGFNVMTQQIKQLMHSVVEKEKAKRRAELAALHAQINPHFLYNTLDAIVWMAEYNPPEAAKMTEQLAKLFRLALGKGSDIATIEQEMEYVQHYLSIQSMRYKNKFEYRVEWEPSVNDQQIPKLVVQVLVENAIYHGIKPKRQKCFLLVKAHLEGDHVIVQVVDDGVGMASEKIAEVFDKNYSPNKAWGGVGVKNVRERVRLYFGSDYGLQFYSIQGVGTLAEIHIPFQSDVTKSDNYHIQ